MVKMNNNLKYDNNMKKSIISISLMLSFVLIGFQAMSQELPLMKVRFNNPHYDCPTHLYCVDVEFQSNTADLKVFGVNVRFFYDRDLMRFYSIGDYVTGYSSPEPPQLIPGPTGSGSFFGLSGRIEWFNGMVQLSEPTDTVISTTGWTKLFNVCFKVVDPSYLMNHPNFCPTIVWDLQEDFVNGGFFPGDDGVVISTVLSYPDVSAQTTENVVQFNWVYDAVGEAYGHPVEDVCILTDCFIIPVANWAIYLGIGLMVVASVVIYRRRIG
jgi:hypothetical protein